MSRTQQKNEELTAITKEKMSHITKLEASLQDVNNDKDIRKKSVLHLQQVIDGAGERKQVRMYFIRPLDHVSFSVFACNWFFCSCQTLQ